MRVNEFRGLLCPFLVVLCVLILNQQSFAGTWTDAFEDNNTREWEIINAFDEEGKWSIDSGEAVGETFGPHPNLIWATGELNWQTYSVSCRAKFVKVKRGFAVLGLILHLNWEESLYYVCRIFYPWEIVHITKLTLEGEDILEEFDFATKLNTWYTLTASIDNRGKIQFQIDDEVFTAVDANPIKNGKAGLIVGGAQVRFDDVEITGNNIPNGGPGTLPVAPTGKLATIWGQLKRL